MFFHACCSSAALLVALVSLRSAATVFFHACSSAALLVVPVPLRSTTTMHCHVRIDALLYCTNTHTFAHTDAHVWISDLEGVDPGRSMSEWSLRQEAYHMWEPQPMRCKSGFAAERAFGNLKT
eukprot:scaffold148789_cov19-Tisochrysis_lutea.AAC.1